MTDQPVEGGLFRRNYLRPVQKLNDSMRARRRIYRLDNALHYTFSSDFVALVQSELGISFPFIGDEYDHERYWTRCDVHDFLDSITLLYLVSPTRTETLAEMRRIFTEEHLRFRIDDQGGVHYLVDEQFERNVAATLDGLGPARFKAARDALEQALESMSGATPSGKSLIRGVFEAVESAFLARIQSANANRLNDQSINSHLRPILEARYANVPDSDDKINRVLELLMSWVRTAHPFRHGVPFDQIHEAPLDYAILLADQGMAFLRHIVAP
jgi:hypothetical protein